MTEEAEKVNNDIYRSLSEISGVSTKNKKNRDVCVHFI